MSQLKTRLAKLEARTGPGRYIAVRSSQKMTEAEMDGFLMAQGIMQTKGDEVLHIITTFEDGPAVAMDAGHPQENCWIVDAPRLVAVQPLQRSF